MNIEGMTTKQLMDYLNGLVGKDAAQVYIAKGSNRVVMHSYGDLLSRRCLSCGRMKRSDELTKRQLGIMGYSSECKDCLSERLNEYSQTVNGNVSNMLRDLYAKARNKGVEIPKPSASDVNTLIRRYEMALRDGCPYSGKSLDRSNISMEHVTAIHRHDADVFDDIGGWVMGVIFVDITENIRKYSKSYLEYTSEFTLQRQVESQRMVAAQLGITLDEFESIMVADDIAYLTSKGLYHPTN